MKKTIFFLLAISTFFFVLNSCTKEEINIEYNYYPKEDYTIISEHLNLPPSPLSYQFRLPSYAGSKVISFDADKAALGRVLFYDKNLSKDRTVSCASCHKQELAFSDDVAFSKGIENRKTERNSLALGAVFSFEEHYGGQVSTSISSSPNGSSIQFFWDNRVHSVEQQATETFANINEMGMSLPEVMARINEQPYYAPLIKAVYGSDSYFTKTEMLDAMTVFINSIGSFSSPFDRELEKIPTHKFDELASVNLNGLTTKQNLGKTLFMNNCSSCHGAINGLPAKFEANNGLSLNYEDGGIGEITGSNNDEGVFKVPVLRNILLTAPYMHDGSIATIEEVIDHYSNGIQNHSNLDPKLKQGNQAKKFNFTADEKAALIAFMESFTDYSLLNDERYSDPFE